MTRTCPLQQAETTGPCSYRRWCSPVHFVHSTDALRLTSRCSRRGPRSGTVNGSRRGAARAAERQRSASTWIGVGVGIGIGIEAQHELRARATGYTVREDLPSTP